MSTLGRIGMGALVLYGAVHLSSNASGASAASTDPIPADYLAHYKAAAGTCPNLTWELLAGVGKIETNHGRARLPGVTGGSNFAGAEGPMQFLPATFATVRRRHPDVGGDIYEPAAAVTAAAHYLCDSGVAHGDITGALWAYNHSITYGANVRAQAAAYQQMHT